jgi:hypothetical protein
MGANATPVREPSRAANERVADEAMIDRSWRAIQFIGSFKLPRLTEDGLPDKRLINAEKVGTPTSLGVE